MNLAKVYYIYDRQARVFNLEFRVFYELQHRSLVDSETCNPGLESPTLELNNTAQTCQLSMPSGANPKEPQK